MKRILGLCAVLVGMMGVASCESAGDPNDPYADNAFGSSSDYLTKCQNPNPSVPQGNFCDDPACPCNLGEGDCDTNAQCVAPYACTGTALHFGQTINYNVCAGALCNDHRKDGDETAVDCGGSCGTTNCPANACTGLPANGRTGHCTSTCPCSSGGASCTSSACIPGLTCVAGAGPNWGFGATIAVCELPTCRDGIMNGNETAADCGGSCHPCGGVAQLSFRKGGTSNDSAAEVALDTSGNIIVAGKFSGSINLGGTTLVSAGNSDIFVAKYTSAGAHVWSKRFGGTGADADTSLDVAVDNAGSVYLSGNIYGAVDFGGGARQSVGATSSAFLAKFNKSGVHVWSKAFGGTQGNRMKAVAVTTAGVVFVTGAFQDSINLGGATFTSKAPGTTLQDIFVAKFNTNGVHQWSTAYGSPTDDQGLAIAVDSDGNPIVGGHFSGTVAFGTKSLTSTGNNDGFGVKLLGTTGATVWATKFGGTGDDRVLGVAVGANKHPVFSGYYRGSATLSGTPVTGFGSTDVFVSSNDTAAGTLRWQHAFGGTGADFGISVAALTSSSEVAVTGYFQGTMNPGGGAITSAGSNDIFIARYSSSGAVSWQKRFGGVKSDQAAGVAASASTLVVDGNFAGTSSFGGASLVSAGGTDVFVSKYTF